MMQKAGNLSRRACVVNTDTGRRSCLSGYFAPEFISGLSVRAPDLSSLPRAYGLCCNRSRHRTVFSYISLHVSKQMGRQSVCCIYEIIDILMTFIPGVPSADILRTYFLLVLPRPPRAPLFRSRLLTLQLHRCLPVLPALRRPTCGSALFVATLVVVGTVAHMRSLTIKQQRIYMHWSLKRRGFGTMLATDMCTGLSKANRMASWLNCLA